MVLGLLKLAAGSANVGVTPTKNEGEGFACNDRFGPKVPEFNHNTFKGIVSCLINQFLGRWRNLLLV